MACGAAALAALLSPHAVVKSSAARTTLGTIISGRIIRGRIIRGRVMDKVLAKNRDIVMDSVIGSVAVLLALALSTIPARRNIGSSNIDSWQGQEAPKNFRFC